MRKEELIERGFEALPNLVLKNIFTLDVGRRRYISIGSLATPNEMVFLNQRDDNGSITDLICVHNFDYDGYLTGEKLDAIIAIFK